MQTLLRQVRHVSILRLSNLRLRLPIYPERLGSSETTALIAKNSPKSVEAVSLTSGFTEALSAVLCTFLYAGKAQDKKLERRGNSTTPKIYIVIQLIKLERCPYFVFD
jgi:hypothetical protein